MHKQQINVVGKSYLLAERRSSEGASCSIFFPTTSMDSISLPRTRFFLQQERVILCMLLVSPRLNPWQQATTVCKQGSMSGVTNVIAASSILKKITPLNLLVGGLNLSETNICQLGWLLTTYGKIKVMFQTTSQFMLTPCKKQGGRMESLPPPREIAACLPNVTTAWYSRSFIFSSRRTSAIWPQPLNLVVGEPHFGIPLLVFNLVGGIPTPLKNMKVSNIWGKHDSKHQPAIKTSLQLYADMRRFFFRNSARRFSTFHNGKNPAHTSLRPGEVV